MCRHSVRSLRAWLGSLTCLLAAGSLLGASWPQAARADEAAVLEEVTVTAQRRAERLQDVPIAITAI
jgi:iron complex outermembrane recepter protein